MGTAGACRYGLCARSAGAQQQRKHSLKLLLASVVAVIAASLLMITWLVMAGSDLDLAPSRRSKHAESGPPGAELGPSAGYAEPKLTWRPKAQFPFGATTPTAERPGAATPPAALPPDEAEPGGTSLIEALRGKAVAMLLAAVDYLDDAHLDEEGCPVGILCESWGDDDDRWEDIVGPKRAECLLRYMEVMPSAALYLIANGARLVSTWQDVDGEGPGLHFDVTDARARLADATADDCCRWRKTASFR